MAEAANMDVLLDPFAYMIKMNRPHPNPKRFDHGWRTDMLAIPKEHKEELALYGMSQSEVDRYERHKRALLLGDDNRTRARLRRRINEVLDKHIGDRSLAPQRYYATQHKLWHAIRGKKFDARMKQYIDATRQSMYHEYDRARLKAKKDKKGKQKGGAKPTKGKRKSTAAAGGKKKKRTNAEIRAAALANVDNLSKPKPEFKPDGINRGKHGDLDPAVMERLIKPKYVTPKYVDDSMTAWRTEHYVSENALTYKPSPRVFELALHKTHAVEPPLPLGFVEPEALRYKPTQRIREMAIPKARSAVQDTDYNEDAFKVSPNALHYKATERIIELAKPHERD